MREVSRDCFVSYKGKKYSVPFRYAGQKVKMKITLEQEIEIFNEQECIAKHPVLSGKAKVIADKGHFEGLHKEKGQKKTKHKGLATHDSFSSVPEVEKRPLASYAAFEESDLI